MLDESVAGSTTEHYKQNEQAWKRAKPVGGAVPLYQLGKSQVCLIPCYCIIAPRFPASAAGKVANTCDLLAL